MSQKEVMTSQETATYRSAEHHAKGLVLVAVHQANELSACTCGQWVLDGSQGVGCAD